MKDIFKLPVFPAAEVLPMLPDDEMQALADSIKKNGLLVPLSVAEVDGTMMLIDGRQRREACRIAGVVPQTRDVTGQDPTDYVLSANIYRKHLNKGQGAMGVALLFPEPLKGGRGKKKGSEMEGFEFGSAHLSRARTVIREAPELCDSVKSGAVSLGEAYDRAIERKKTRILEEEQRADLRRRYPELADDTMEGEGSKTLEEARAEADRRDQQESQTREAVVNILDIAMRLIHALSDDEFAETVAERLANADSRADIMGRVDGGASAVLDRLDGFSLGSARLGELLRLNSSISQPLAK